MFNFKFTCFLLVLIYFNSRGYHVTGHDITEKIMKYLERGVNFMDTYYQQFNLDGLLGLVIAESELLKIKPRGIPLYRLSQLILKCEEISRKIIPLLPKSPKKFILFENILLKPQFWNIDLPFERNLPNLGIYNWSKEYLISDKEAVYHGIHSDVCIQELLEKYTDNICKISRSCKEMMFQNRIDRGYLLTHRLFYLQIGLRSNCFNRNKYIQNLVRRHCTLMFKEAKTNAHLGFPQHDIFLEQMVLCGIEGISDFLTYSWVEKLFDWQTSEGCYTNETVKEFIRSTNIIQFGCTDHTTGLGIAALALHLHYIEENNL